MKKILILFSLFLSAACQQNTSPPTNQTAKPAATVLTIAAPGNTISANALPPISSTKTPDKTKIKNFDGKGVVTKINLELVSVELDHEEIKGSMPKMTMEFYVKEKSELEQLKVGDKVDFVLEDDSGAEQIITIKKGEMNPIKFCKFHGFGNDYIVFEAGDLKVVSSLNEFAQNVCRRNTGIGGDGIAVLERLESEADYSCRIVNPDGSEAGFSGNGTRCAVAYLYYKNLWTAENLKLQTRSGIKNYQLLERVENTFWFRAELGKPKFDLPDSSPDKLIEISEKEDLKTDVFSSIILPQEKLIVKFIYVDVGNPVACLFVENFDQFDWRRVGQAVESHVVIFPERTNVVFVKIIDKENIEIRIWERGAGETSSSGTCSAAAAVASALARKTERKVSVYAEGGMTAALWREDDEMLIMGRADLAFCGEWFEKI